MPILPIETIASLHPSTPQPKRYFILAPILWIETTKMDSYICTSVCYFIPDAWVYRVKKGVNKRAGSGLGTVLLVFIYPIVVSEVVYSDIELWPQPGISFGRIAPPARFYLDLHNFPFNYTRMMGCHESIGPLKLETHWVFAKLLRFSRA